MKTQNSPGKPTRVLRHRYRSHGGRATSVRTLVVEGETWRYRLTAEEYAEWVKYDTAHSWLGQVGYEPVLRMFLTNYRSGVNLNQPLKR